MPATLTAFAFRKSRFPIPFDESLSAGADYRWIFENLRNGADGALIPINLVYTRQPARQRLKEHLETLYMAHESFMGTLTNEDRWSASVLAGFNLPDGFLDRIEGYAARLLNCVSKTTLYDRDEVGQLLSFRLVQLKALQGNNDASATSASS